MTPSGPAVFCGGRFLIINLISLLDIGLLRFSVSPAIGLGRLYFSRDLSVLSGLLNKKAYCFLALSCL